MKERVLALIPARGGSKGLPGKNILPLLGKPLIAWTIEQAKKCEFIDKIVVSTDNRDIADVAEQYGAEVPFLRPASLASDGAKSIDVIYHAIDFFEEKKDYYDILILLEPTSPLREVDDITIALQTLREHARAQSIVGVAKCESIHPEFLLHIDQNGFIRNIHGESTFIVLRRQELTDYYHFEGSLYISYIQALKERGSFYHELTIPYVVKRYQAPEVDELSDFICIEALMKARMEGKI